MSGVQSIERAFTLLRALSSGPLGVTQLSERVGLPKSTVSRLLSTLDELGAVEQLSDGGHYRLGSTIAELAGSTQPTRSLAATARPHLLELMRSSGEATGLSVPDGDEAFYLDQVDGENPVQVRDWTGDRIPMHVVSAGLVFLAFDDGDLVDRYTARPLPRFTDQTVTDPAALRTRLDGILADGYAWVYEEYALGINSVAAPVRDGSGAVVAAIHTHGPAYRFPPNAERARRFAEMTMQTAQRVSYQLGFAPP
jgi:DNA-binding IclR family transcriptional regulator